MSTKKRYLKLAGAFLGFAVVLIVAVLFDAPSEPSSPPSQKATPSVLPVTATPETTPTHQPDIAGTTDTVLVTRVVDGDTIEIATGQKVRYIGIDTPETVHPSKPVEFMGKEASARNKQLVREGYAKASSYPPDIKYQDRFRAAETDARNRKVGLWSESEAPPTVSPAPANDATGQVKGNISSSGEKIYHVPGCRDYNKTKINPEKGEQYFSIEAEAKAAGWRKARNCP